MNSCPRCKGTTGFEYRDPAVLVYSATWGTPREKWEFDEVDHGNHPLPRTVRCLDCGARVRRADMEGDDE